MTIGILTGLFYVALITLFVTLHRRNKAVRDYRMDLIHQVSAAADSDIDRGNFDWQWRYQGIGQASYSRMAWMFWRPLDDFYPDRSFIDPEATGPREEVSR